MVELPNRVRETHARVETRQAYRAARTDEALLVDSRCFRTATTDAGCRRMTVQAR
ncbi:hypothetical protein GCM10009540_60590 [Streptomyces turgidiscabies]